MTKDTPIKTAPERVWVLTDGKAGDAVQCVAIAKGLGRAFEKKIVAPRPPWEWTAPWGPIDPRDAPARAGSPIAPPFPHIVVASGRRAIPYALRVKKEGGAFLVLLKDPRIAPGRADLVWAPTHDRLEGANVFSTLTAPHGLAEEIARRRAAPAPAIAAARKPMLGVILGGPSGRARFDAETAASLAAMIAAARKDYASVAIARSRRTPTAFFERIRAGLSEGAPPIFEAEGENLYADILANAAALVVTADSHNMMSEALATGAGIYAWRPPGLARKFEWFVCALEAQGVARPFAGDAPPFSYAPVDATGEIVAKIRQLRARSHDLTP